MIAKGLILIDMSEYVVRDVVLLDQNYHSIPLILLPNLGVLMSLKAIGSHQVQVILSYFAN